MATNAEKQSFNNLLQAVYDGNFSRDLAERFGAAVDHDFWVRTLEAHRGEGAGAIVISEVLDDVEKAKADGAPCPKLPA